MSVLTVLMCLFIPGAFFALYHGGVPTALAVFGVGVIGGVVTYVFFVSGLLQGDFFPKFVPDESPNKRNGLGVLFAVHGATAADYGKMLLWGFIAGFSERFATDIISRFEYEAASGRNKSEPVATPEANPSEPEAEIPTDVERGPP